MKGEIPQSGTSPPAIGEAGVKGEIPQSGTSPPAIGEAGVKGENRELY